MTYFYTVLQIIAGTGAFLIGFKLMSDGTEKLADKRLHNLFAKTGKNDFVGVGIGAGVTAIIQSSGATTVMVVGFVNAGVMTLRQATAVIMGANIGTTITGQIAALQSFDIVQIFTILTCVGIFMNMFSTSDKIKTLGLAMSGLGLVFLGLKYMSGPLAVIKESEVIRNAFASISNPFILLIIGALITALVHSSSAVTTILISMASAGLVIGNGGNSMLYVVLGTNIGTCLTAMMSSMGANTNARRAALIHMMFNLFGSALFFILLSCWSSFMDVTFAKWFDGLPGTQIAMFHTFFNLAATVIFFPLIPMFVKASQLLIKDKPEVAPTKFTYLDDRFLQASPIAISQAKKEIARMSDIAMNSVNIGLNGFLKKDMTTIEAVTKRTKDLSEVNNNVIDYLVKISTSSLSLADEKRVSSLHHVVGDVLRVGELADNLTKYTKHAVEDGLVFSEEVKISLQEMLDLINQLYSLSVEAFTKKDFTLLSKIDVMEDEIDNSRRALIADHIKRLNEGKCQPQSSGVFINLVANLERIADHLQVMGHSIEAEKVKKGRGVLPSKA